MKQKIVEFFKEKKELLLFVGVLGAVFTMIIIIANLALKGETDTPVDIPVKTDNDEPVVIPDDPNIEPEVLTFKAPVDNEVQVVRVFYDMNKSKDILTSAVISYDSKLIESKGVTYANTGNEGFNVYLAYDATVTDVSNDEIYGNIVAVDYGSNVIGIYSSLSSVAVQKGDKLNQGALIGVSPQNAYDALSANHLAYEMKVNGTFIDPELSYGHTLEEVKLLVETIK